MIPGLGRSPGKGKGFPLQYSGLDNSMDCIVHGVAESLTRLSDFHFHTITLSEDTLILNLYKYNNVAFFLVMPLVLKAWSPNHRTVREFP